MAFDPDGPGEPGALFGVAVEAQSAQVHIIPVRLDATASGRRGTCGGPDAVLDASSQVDLCDLETGRPWEAGIAWCEPDLDVAAVNAVLIDQVERSRSGDANATTQVNAGCARVHAAVEQTVARTLAVGRIPGVLGGDHSCAIGAHRAAAAHHPGLGVLQVDAHADLRVAYEGFDASHASVMDRLLETEVARLVQVGIRDLGTAERIRQLEDPRIRAWTDVELAAALAEGEPWSRQVDRIVEALPEEVWISFDIDGLDPSLCPATGTPVPGGLGWREALFLLARVGRSRRIVGFDLCEVGPAPWDGTVGARLLYKLAGWALISRQAP